MSDAIRKEIIGVGAARPLSLYPRQPPLLLPLRPVPQHGCSSEGVRNFCGRAGSYTADFLVQLFGVMSYVLIGFILIFSVLYLGRRSSAICSCSPPVSSSSSSPCPPCSRYVVGRIQMKTVVIPFSGFVGVLLERGLLHAFSYFGSLLLAVVLFLISLFLIAQVPLFSIVGARLRRKKARRGRQSPSGSSRRKGKSRRRERKRSGKSGRRSRSRSNS